MNIFQQMSGYLKRIAPLSKMARPAMPPVYKMPPSTEHGLRFTEQITPSNKAELSRAINKPIKRGIYIPIFRPKKERR